MSDERLLENWEREARACLRGDHSQRELQLAAVIVTLVDELRATRDASLAPAPRQPAPDEDVPYCEAVGAFDMLCVLPAGHPGDHLMSRDPRADAAPARDPRELKLYGNILPLDAPDSLRLSVDELARLEAAWGDPGTLGGAVGLASPVVLRLIRELRAAGTMGDGGKYPRPPQREPLTLEQLEVLTRGQVRWDADAWVLLDSAIHHARQARVPASGDGEDAALLKAFIRDVEDSSLGFEFAARRLYDAARQSSPSQPADSGPLRVLNDLRDVPASETTE